MEGMNESNCILCYVVYLKGSCDGKVFEDREVAFTYGEGRKKF